MPRGSKPGSQASKQASKQFARTSDRQTSRLFAIEPDSTRGNAARRGGGSKQDNIHRAQSVERGFRTAIYRRIEEPRAGWTAANRGCRNSGWSAPTRWNSVPRNHAIEFCRVGIRTLFTLLFPFFSLFFTERASSIMNFKLFPGNARNARHVPILRLLPPRFEQRVTRTDPCWLFLVVPFARTMFPFVYLRPRGERSKDDFRAFVPSFFCFLGFSISVI